MMSSDPSSEQQEDDERSHHSTHDDSDSERQSCNKRKLLKVMKKLKHLKRTAAGQHETKIRYHGPYIMILGERGSLYRNNL